MGLRISGGDRLCHEDSQNLERIQVDIRNMGLLGIREGKRIGRCYYIRRLLHMVKDCKDQCPAEVL